jgi:hypothetical protein
LGTPRTIDAPRIVDDLLRRRATEALGALGDELARMALEGGRLEVQPDAAIWDGSHGVVHGDRVFVVLPRAVHDRLAASPSAQDCLSRAIASGVADGTESRALFDVRYEVGGPSPARAGGPYRDA